MRCFVVLSLVLVACGATAPSDGPPSPTAATGSSSTADPSNRVSVRVISVTDGDTIRVMLNGKSTPIRYIGIDTPETVDPRKVVQCFGAEATAANRRLVEGGFVELERDVSNTDKYDRLLRYVWVERDGKSVMVNEELVRAGSQGPAVTRQTSSTRTD